MRKELLGDGVDENLVKMLARPLSHLADDEIERTIFLARERAKELRKEGLQRLLTSKKSRKTS